MPEQSIPINGGEARIRADVAERHGIKPYDAIAWPQFYELRREEAELRRKERGE